MSDAPVAEPARRAPPNAVLLVDGVFLLRPELFEHWDYRIFVDVAFDTAVQRASVRDQDHLGAAEQVRARYWRRYVPGQHLYLDTVHPRERADVLIDNNDPADPQLVVRG